jgi:hypothetical protein
VVSFTRLAALPRAKSRRYPLDRRLGGPQSLSGRYGEEKTIARAQNRTPVIQPVARRCTVRIRIELKVAINIVNVFIKAIQKSQEHSE